MSQQDYAPPDTPWLFGQRTDLWAFGGSAVVSMLLLAVGGATGMLAGDAPWLLWLVLVVCIDVAHVWTTLFRVYLDGDEVRRRPFVYGLTPVLTYLALVCLHAVSAAFFWRGLAYVAVFHFVRQQAGWLNLYNQRGPSAARIDQHLERTTLYASMLYPLAHWHAHLPRDFHWFIDGDFVPGLPAGPVAWLEAPYWGLLACYGARQLQLLRQGTLHPGKLLLIATTWACWHLGIITFGSDYGFTVTNVLVHGVPYAVLVYRYADARRQTNPRTWAARVMGGGLFAYAGVCIALAAAEETAWDLLVWHEYASAPGPLGSLQTVGWLVPLLALPQATHYVLDGVIWKRRRNPAVARALQTRQNPVG